MNPGVPQSRVDELRFTSTSTLRSVAAEGAKGRAELQQVGGGGLSPGIQREIGFMGS